MAKIRDATPKQSSGSYERLVGNPQLASLFVKAQSTVISNGTELEKIICNQSCMINDLDKFVELFDKRLVPDGSYLCNKKILKKSKYALPKHEPDFLMFIVGEAVSICYVIELKDGDSFDTKKSSSEKEMLMLVVNHLAPKVPFRLKLAICCFNQEEKEKIVAGFKGNFSMEEVMTGREFCKLLGIDYDAIVSLRGEDAEDNFRYVIEQLVKMPDVRKKVINDFRAHIVEKEFYCDTEQEE